MSEMTGLRQFLKEREKTLIPTNDVARIKLLAKELAMGAHFGMWNLIAEDQYGSLLPLSKVNEDYVTLRWPDFQYNHCMRLLQSYGYLSTTGSAERLTTKAFELLSEADPHNVFVSYKRSENSMFVLLVNNTLKLYGFTPFFDMELNPTEEWHARLEERVKESDYLVVLLGPETHRSKYTVREIYWAVTHRTPVVQVRRHDFIFDPSNWAGIEYP